MRTICRAVKENPLMGGFIKVEAGVGVGGRWVWGLRVGAKRICWSQS